MEKHIVDEKTGISYTLQGDYYIPDFTLPPETDNRPIGVWGAGVLWTPLPKAEAPTEPAGETRRHRDFLKNHRKAIYSIMLMDNTLHSYLADINEQIIYFLGSLSLHYRLSTEKRNCRSVRLCRTEGKADIQHFSKVELKKIFS